MADLQLRSFDAEGIREFERIIDRARNGEKIPDSLRNELLESGPLTRVIAPRIRLSPIQFANRLEAGNHLVHLLTGVASLVDSEDGKGMWAWLTLYFFDSVCPVDSDGKHVVGEQRELYIPDFTNFRRYYRHLLLGPFNICRAHSDNPERALAVLCPPVHRPGDVVESLASRQNLITSAPVMEAATALYVRNGQYKPHARRKNRGGARRFAAVMMQFDTTYDLDRIPVGKLLEILPHEFDDFRP